MNDENTKKLRKLVEGKPDRVGELLKFYERNTSLFEQNFVEGLQVFQQNVIKSPEEANQAVIPMTYQKRK